MADRTAPVVEVKEGRIEVQQQGYRELLLTVPQSRALRVVLESAETWSEQQTEYNEAKDETDPSAGLGGT